MEPVSQDVEKQNRELREGFLVAHLAFQAEVHSKNLSLRRKTYELMVAGEGLEGKMS
jgi:hypothetical protein